MEQKLARLKAILGEVADLNHVAALLGWDQQTYMPPGGAEARGYHLATISRLAHEKFTSDEVGVLLEDLKKETRGLAPDSDEARLVKIAARDHEKSIRVPPEFVAEFAQATTKAHEAWVEARRNSDFAAFRPHLEKILELQKRYISFFPPADHPYDTLLDNFEPGMKTAEVKEIFDTLRPKQVELLQAITSSAQVDDSFLHQAFPEKEQWDFGVDVITKFGYDWTRGRQDKTAHPFTTSFSINDVRITTRFMEEFLPSALFGTMHEAGHGMYEQGVSQAYERTPLADGASLAVHESQSRMWENLVGRSIPFWEHFYPGLQERFPAQLGNVDLQTFYKGINKVEPSLIRVEADEATYNMHIMLRLELEIDMVEGNLEIKDLPEAWNAKMEEYLGVLPPNDAQGVLQDIHWSGGMMGYFSTYALGNLISVQLWEKIGQAIPDLPEQIRQGKFDALLGWLRENIHQYGRKYEPQELVQKVTGSKITPEPYLRYLQSKYNDIYGL
ncbi:MAG: carboxypeptidase M32 [Chloroflexi bacterium]|nr:carboxypeptidase M32 [Chloroflexota bacterium]